MARFQFPSVHTSNDYPATPRKQDMHKNDEDVQELCNFMPQSSAPLMMMSATSRRTRESTADRAIQLLLPETGDINERIRAPNAWMLAYGQSAGPELNDYDYESDDDEIQAHHFDSVGAHKAPTTPPHTPLMPMTNVSFASFASSISITSFTDLLTGVRVNPLTAASLIVSMTGILLILTTLALLGTEGLREAFWKPLHYSWFLIVKTSGIVEALIEGAGWIIGRAVGRFGRGFERGYRI